MTVGVEGQYYLMPALYATRKFKSAFPEAGEGSFLYSNTEIDAISRIFDDLDFSLMVKIGEIQAWLRSAPQETVPPYSGQLKVLRLRIDK